MMIYDEGGPILCVNIDGSIFAEWERLEVMAMRPVTQDFEWAPIWARMALAWRGRLREVSYEESQRIGREFGR